MVSSWLTSAFVNQQKISILYTCRGVTPKILCNSKNALNEYNSCVHTFFFYNTTVKLYTDNSDKTTVTVCSIRNKQSYMYIFTIQNTSTSLAFILASQHSSD